MLDPHEAQLCAILELQKLRRKHRPGSRRYEEIEYALDLALNKGRAVTPYFLRNLLRDARRILDRQARGRQHVPIAPDNPDDVPDGETVGVVLVDFTTPDAQLEAVQLAQAIVQEAQASSRHAARIFEGLISGEGHAETAREIGISTARVTQVRRTLRETTVRLLENDHGS